MVATVLSSLSTWEVALLAALFAELVVLLGALFPPVGIVALELAGSATRAQAIVDGWRARGLVGAARRNVYIDFAFIPAYATLVALVVVLATRLASARGFLGDHAEGVGAALVLAALVAGACDVLENAALLGMLPEGTKISGARAQTARGFALAKFGLLGVGLLWMAGVTIVSYVRWLV